MVWVRQMNVRGCWVPSFSFMRKQSIGRKKLNNIICGNFTMLLAHFDTTHFRKFNFNQNMTCLFTIKTNKKVYDERENFANDLTEPIDQ